MDINELITDISLNKEVANQVLRLINNDNEFKNPERYLKLISNQDTDFETLKKELSDTNGFKLLGFDLIAALSTYNLYLEKGIAENIYLDTFKCISRFIDESYNVYHEYLFDRYYWLPRQLNLSLFRIGELEFEILKKEKEISIHIPSDANLNLKLVINSIFRAKDFFKKYFKESKNYSYSCYSYLLMPNLKFLLKAPSNILNFQKLFKICKVCYEDKSYLMWIFQTKNEKLSTLKAETTLQKNLKDYLLKGNYFGSALGYIDFLKLEEFKNEI